MRIFTEEDLSTEVWEDLKGLEEFAQISTLGRIKNKKTGHIYNLGYYSNGYEQLSMTINEKRYTAIVHRLVAKQFIPNLENKPQVNHKNGIRDDNRVCNLEWCTQSENLKHSFRELNRERRDMKGEKNTRSILNEQQVLEIRRLYEKEGKTNLELSKIYNMNPPAIWKIIHRYTWKHI